MDRVPTVVTWMRANEDLSGWAQAVGAFIALFIAIAIPAWQRRQQRSDTRLEELTLDVTLGSGVFFVLNDAELWINEMIEKTFMTRNEARTDFIFNDLIERILLWEGRETNDHRVISLYLTRGAIARTQNKLAWSVLQRKPIMDGEIVLLKADHKIVCDQKDFAKRLLDHAVFRLNLKKLPFWARPIFWWKHRHDIRTWIAPAPTIRKSGL